MVRCKFKCSSKSEIKNATTGEVTHVNIRMTAVCDGSEENKAFFKWTPNGYLDFGAVNPAAVEQIKQDKEYYIDIYPCPLTSGMPTNE